MRRLYHFQYSPFSRRTRLALAHKKLDVELREARDEPAALEEARRLVPLRTIPVLVDGERVLGDSAAITRWLDAAYPSAPRLWPDGDEAFAAIEVAALVDVVLNHVIDPGTRYFALRGDAAWEGVKREMLGRAQRAAEALAARAAALGRPTVARSGWSAADMWLFTLVAWVESWPAREKASQNIAQIRTLGFVLPESLSRWADAHRAREDVRALD